MNHLNHDIVTDAANFRTHCVTCGRSGEALMTPCPAAAKPETATKIAEKQNRERRQDDAIREAYGAFMEAHGPKEPGDIDFGRDLMMLMRLVAQDAQRPFVKALETRLDLVRTTPFVKGEAE